MRLIYAALLSLSLLVAGRTPAGDLPTLTRVSQVRHLSREEADKSFPVHLRGVVTWVGYNWFVIQDDSAGLTVHLAFAQKSEFWKGDDAEAARVSVGDEVEVEGVSHAGGFAPDILPRSLRIVGKQALPPARPMVPLRFFNGADAGERIEVRGVVQGFQKHPSGNLTLHLNVNPGQFTAEVYNSALKDPKAIVDAEVVLRGVAGTFFNSRGEATGVRLLVSRSEDLLVEKPATGSPFDAPRLALNQLLPFCPEPAATHRQLVEGTVTYAQSDHVFYIQEGSTAVRIETMGVESLAPGDRVQVAGFVDRQRAVAGMADALVRKTGDAALPKPMVVMPDKILLLNAKSLMSGVGVASSDFDGRLITFKARLVSIQPSPNGRPPWHRIELDAGGIIVEALLYKGYVKAFQGVQLGSELQVTGIAEMLFDLTQQKQSVNQIPPHGIRLWLRNLDDVTVVRAPTWWTPKHFLGLFFLGATLSLVIWLWERQRGRRRIELLEAERALERDRIRIARDLHDELGVGLTEIGLLGDLVLAGAGNAPEQAGKISGRARELVSALDEIVWAVNPANDNSLSLGDYFSRYAQTLLQRAGLHCQIDVSPMSANARISAESRHHLFLAFKEALNNILTHARAKGVTIRIALETGLLTISVSDDGCGMSDPAGGAGSNGLRNMRERLQNLGGRCEVESGPGRGTKIVFTLPVKN